MSKTVIHTTNDEQSELVPPTHQSTAFEVEVEKKIGKIVSVFHEVVSDVIHIDILLIEKNDRYILITHGMSDLPMSVPKGLEEFKFAELTISLPKTWDLKQLDDENNYWPIRWLKILARLPHKYNTFLWLGHSVPVSDAESLSSNNKFAALFISVASSLNEDQWKITLPDKKVYIYGVYPIYQTELDFKLAKSGEDLEKLIWDKGYSDFLDIKRKALV